MLDFWDSDLGGHLVSISEEDLWYIPSLKYLQSQIRDIVQGSDVQDIHSWFVVKIHLDGVWRTRNVGNVHKICFADRKPTSFWLLGLWGEFSAQN